MNWDVHEAKGQIKGWPEELQSEASDQTEGFEHSDLKMIAFETVVCCDHHCYVN